LHRKVERYSFLTNILVFNGKEIVLNKNLVIFYTSGGREFES